MSRDDDVILILVCSVGLGVGGVVWGEGFYAAVVWDLGPLQGVKDRELGAFAPFLPSFILLVSSSDILIVVSLLDIGLSFAALLSISKGLIMHILQFLWELWVLFHLRISET